MRKRIFNSVISISLSVALIVSCPAMGSISFATTEDSSVSTEDVLAQDKTLSIEGEIPAEVVAGEEAIVLTSEGVQTLAEEYDEAKTQTAVEENEELKSSVDVVASEEQVSQLMEDVDEASETYTIATDNEVAVYASSSVTINATNFPDANFRQYVKNEIDIDGNGVLSSSEIRECTSIDCSSMGISSLKGIEIFYNLETLFCICNNLSSLDVGKNKTLVDLYCSANRLSVLDVNGCTVLRRLRCSENNIKNLNVSGCTALEWVDCYENELTSLDVSGSTALAHLDCRRNNLTSLNVSRNTNLWDLDCSENNISSLNVSGSKALADLNCVLNNISNLDVSKNMELRTLKCATNNLKNLDVSKNTALTDLDCSGNTISSLDVSRNKKLGYLDCAGNNLSNLDISENTILETLWCSYNNLSILDVSKNNNLKNLYCDNTKIRSLNVSGHKYLTELYCNGCSNLKSIDASNCTTLETLVCIHSGINSLNVSNCTALMYLSCEGNNLSSLNVSTCTALINLYCSKNSISSLDISRNKALITLDCDSNNLSSIDVSNNHSLAFLICSYNNLGVLSISKNTALTYLDCGQNNLSNLDLSNNTALQTLYCWGNNIKSLDISKNTQLSKIVLVNKPNVNIPTKVSSGVNISWSKSIGANGYYVYRRVKGASWTRIADVTGENTLSYTDNTVSSGMTYEYTVRGYYQIFDYDDVGFLVDVFTYLSDYDLTGKSITIPGGTLSTPKLSSVENVNGGVKITWGKVSGAAKYRVYYKTGSGSWTKIADTTSTSYTWIGAKSGTKYAFTVRCLSSDGKSFTSSYDSTGKSLTYVAAPKISSVSNTATGVKISWGKVTGAAKYRVYYKTGSGSWSKIADTTSTSYTWTGAKSGTKYTFTIRCLSSDGKSFTSSYDSTGKSILYLSQPKISKIEVDNSGVKITWGKVTGAKNYRIYYMSANEWYMLKETSDTSFTLNAVKGNTYKYTVKALNGSTTSSYHSGMTFKRLETPKLSSVSNTSNGVKVSWGKVTGAAKYRIYYKAGNGNWTKVADTTSTSYTWNGAKKGTTYTFTVRCLTGDGKTFTSGYDTTGKKITYTGK